MPVGRRTPRGKRRWYLVHAPGREQQTVERIKRDIPANILDDAFELRKEYVRKRHGEWETLTLPMYDDYIFVVTRDAPALDRALANLPTPLRICRDENRYFMPLSEEVQAWYEQMMDATHTIRTSTAEIIDGRLMIKDGPMFGKENSVTKITRKRCTCDVAVFDGAGNFNVSVPMVIPFKS